MTSIVYFISKILNIYVFLLFLYALLSWFPGGYESRFGKFLRAVCDPYLNIFRSLPLQIGPIDFSVLVAILVLEMVNAGFIKMMMNMGIMTIQ